MNLVENPGAPPTLCLDEMLNLAAARPLAEAIASARGTDLTISLADVRHVGAQCAQILLAGKTAWSEDGHALHFVDATPAFHEGLQMLGLADYFPDEESSQ